MTGLPSSGANRPAICSGDRSPRLRGDRRKKVEDMFAQVWLAFQLVPAASGVALAIPGLSALRVISVLTVAP